MWPLPLHPVFSLQLSSYFENLAFHYSGINYTIKLLSDLAVKNMSANFRSASGDGTYFLTWENPVTVYLCTPSSFRSF